MKTIKKSDEIKRVSDKDAMKFVAGGWSYIPKEEWKKTRSVKVAKSVKKAEKK
jgi:hypothetical protein